MSRYHLLKLTEAELGILCAIIGFVEAGEISGGPLEDENPAQQRANLSAMARLKDKIKNS